MTHCVRATAPATPTGGFYHCERCSEIVTPGEQEIDFALSMPEADHPLKCPHCHKLTVHWRALQSVRRPRPAPRAVSVEDGKPLFAHIREVIAAAAAPRFFSEPDFRRVSR